MPMDVKFENGSEGVGVSMPWNPRKRKEGEEMPELPLSCQWMKSYIALEREKEEKQEREKQEHKETKQ